jgi:hypothetical protein
MTRKWLVVVLTALSAGFLFAQDDTNADADPGPGRGVARISVINGEVSVRRGDSGEVVAAAMNAPLMAQDALLTSSSSRTEIQLDSTNVLRVGANSEVRMSGLDYKKYQIQVATGIVTFTVLRTSDAQVELDTPSVGIKPLKPGAYRITVHEDGSSEISVRAGQAEIYNQQGSQRLEQGQSMQVKGNPADPEFQVVQAPQLDAWDRWNADRDQALTKARSREYVSPDINGAEDLDQYGKWVNDPTYGNVWSPSAAPGWAPYQDGRWVWEDSYGWTWVSNDPWGWAPYHYGRWFNGPAGWCWYPGQLYGRHYWSPALVGFFGWGGGVGFGFGFANVGWVPLAPFESFHPWWGRGFGGGRYFNNTTIVNNVNVANVYRNARFANAVSGVSANEFGRRTGRFSAIGSEQIRTAGLVRGGLPVTPQRSSLQFSDRQVNANRFPQTRNDRFFAHNQPVTAQRVPFEQQQRSMQQTTLSRGNFSANTAVGSRPSGLSNSIGQPGTGTTTHGWSRFGEPIHGTNATRPVQLPRAEQNFNNSRGSLAPSAGASNAGNPSWRRFGTPSSGSLASPSRSYEPPSRGSDRPAAAAPRSFGGSTYTPPPRSNFEPQVSGGGRLSSGWNSNSGSVRISPPIVRERAPSYGGGSYHPAPSYSGGSRPSPSFNGGGSPKSSGGGGGRPSGGGGHSSSGGHSSGGHSSGGGGHHGR